jgi:hypothetical protein
MAGRALLRNALRNVARKKTARKLMLAGPELLFNVEEEERRRNEFAPSPDRGLSV